LVPSAEPRLEDLLRELTPQVLGALVRRRGQFEECEDAVQEALLAAALQWPKDGLPQRPRSWLLTAADRALVDALRSDSARRRREVAVALESADPVAEEVAGSGDEDDTLALLVLCCHPALSEASQLALTLRAVGGLTTAEIAAAFLVPETTMAQRIARAKQRIKQAGARFELPTQRERSARLQVVLQALYLIFNEGYATSSGPTLARAPTSPPRRFGSPACCTACCPAKARSPACSR
jgi:RNA polymerase sigma factor (sigma-70 family)